MFDKPEEPWLPKAPAQQTIHIFHQCWIQQQQSWGRSATIWTAQHVSINAQSQSIVNKCFPNLSKYASIHNDPYGIKWTEETFHL
jgi:hypothetical protein